MGGDLPSLPSSSGSSRSVAWKSPDVLSGVTTVGWQEPTGLRKDSATRGPGPGGASGAAWPQAWPESGRGGAERDTDGVLKATLPLVQRAMAARPEVFEASLKALKKMSQV